MRPAIFQYQCPEGLDEVLELIGEDARPLAGGQSLIALMNLRFARPEMLVDLKGIEELKKIEVSDNYLSIGAMATQASVEKSKLVLNKCPLISRSVGMIGHWQIRTKGTVGGNLAHSDPASELPAAMITVDAKYILVSKSGRRKIPAREFHLGAYDTALREDELLERILVPCETSIQRSALVETVRAAGAYAIAGAVAQITKRDDYVDRIRIVLFGTGSKPYEVEGIEGSLRNVRMSPKYLEELKDLVSIQSPEFGDFHATAIQRKRMHGSLAKRAVFTAWNSFQEEEA
tara:strand:+ start:9145 stop:10011 length:867 start_codon:yes stop_codon:yes gene_type:complete